MCRPIKKQQEKHLHIFNAAALRICRWWCGGDVVVAWLGGNYIVGAAVCRTVGVWRGGAGCSGGRGLPRFYLSTPAWLRKEERERESTMRIINHYSQIYGWRRWTFKKRHGT